MVRHNRFSSTRTFNEKIINSEINFNSEINNLYKENNYWSEKIEKYSFLTSIRCLAYRLGYLNNYKTAKEIYKRIMNNEFYRNGLKKYKYNEPFKRIILFKLFKYKLCFLLYVICKLKNKKNREESFEIL